MPPTLADAVRAGLRPAVLGAAGGLVGLVLADLQRALGRPLVVVAPDPARAALIEDALGFFFPSPNDVTGFPAYDHLPFQGMSPARPHVMERVATLTRLHAPHALHPAPRAVVVPAAALVDRVPPAAFFRETTRVVRAGRDVDRDALVDWLVRVGYHRVPQVEDPGTFAVRGGLVDVWSPLHPEPYRIELFGDECERVRAFDPATQASRQATLDELALGPARDIALTDDAVALARDRIGALADERHLPTSRKRSLLADLDQHVLGVGMEELLPAFHPRLDTLFDALATLPWVVVDPLASVAELADRAADLEERAARALTREGELCYPAHALHLGGDEALALLSPRTAATVEVAALTTGERPLIRFDATDHMELRRALERARATGDSDALAPLVERLHAWREDGLAVLACAHSLGGLERLRALLQGHGLRLATPPSFSLADVPRLQRHDVDLHLVVATPGQGFVAPSHGLVVLDESEILGKPPRARRRQRKVPPESLLQSWRDLRPGDLVVHLTHGVGRYLGLTRAAEGGIESDFLELEYADKNKLFVPVDKLHLVTKHQGGDGAPALDKLGGQGSLAWQKTKARIKKATRDIAAHLVKLYAEREASEGFAFSPPDELFRRFEAAFPWDETPDQEAAIADVLGDMMRDRPMDRLVCGDVGFGKTEVAIRAAMKAVLDGKQVAVLVPTQVLAEQHRMTFQRRFEGFPVTVESLSSMRGATRQKEIVAALALGGVDVLIGTHRILSKDVVWKDLGLVIVDEEHRFGVAHKEQLKKKRVEVDVLTLTATPIPRTLHMGMIGLRDMSLIQTPPLDRLPIQTFVAQPTDGLLAEAIGRELARGGQVFFVHHRVSDIEQQAELIARLVPGARVAIGHGQMGVGQLEKIMLRFVTGEANVLVSTTIVESGIDIPNANTILINRADVFGLAQLYQLRGRVGRSTTRGYCYLLVPSPQHLDGDAGARLGAIQQFSELGSGFSVASHDLDIRGAGDLLGADQAGNIDAVGYDAYMELLGQAIAEQRAESQGRDVEPDVDPELKIPVEARVPEGWLPETALRLRLYRAFAGAASEDEVGRVLAAAVDRYGPPPEPVRNLAALMTLKLLAKALRLASVSLGKDVLVLQTTPPTRESALQPAVLLALVSANQGWRLTPEGRLVIPVPPWGPARGLGIVRESLLRLSNFVSQLGRSAPAAAPGEPRERVDATSPARSHPARDGAHHHGEPDRVRRPQAPGERADGGGQGGRLQPRRLPERRVVDVAGPGPRGKRKGS